MLLRMLGTDGDGVFHKIGNRLGLDWIPESKRAARSIPTHFLRAEGRGAALENKNPDFGFVGSC